MIRMIRIIRRLAVDQRGFTLAEILIAAIIVAVALVGLATVVPIAGYGVQEGYNLSTATFLADQKLEQAKNLPWVSLPANDCLGTSASSTAAPTVPAGGQCTDGATNIAAGGAVTWLADESAVTSFPSYARNVRITDCGTAPGCGGVTDAGMRLVTVTVSYTPLNATDSTGTTGPKSIRVQMVVSQR
jgi:prepilin-type N-terminal cleavage/methylation domain-containing protein